MSLNTSKSIAKVTYERIYIPEAVFVRRLNNLSIDVSKSVKQITYNGNNVPLASQPNIATITINIEGWTTQLYGSIFYINHEEKLITIRGSKLTFPMTINTFVNSAITLIPSGWGGVVSTKDLVNCDVAGHQGTFYITLQSAECSVTFYNND